MSRKSNPKVSLPDATLAAYRRHGGPPLSSLTLEAVEAWLSSKGHDVPARPEPHPQTGAATAARDAKRAAPKKRGRKGGKKKNEVPETTA